MKYLKFYRYLFPFWKKEALILFLSLSGAGLSLVNPYLTKLIIDKAYGNKDLRLFITLIALGSFIFIVNSAINVTVNYLNRYIRLRLNLSLSKKVFSKLQSLSYSFFQDNSTGGHLFNMSYDIEQVNRFIADVLPKAVVLIPRGLLIIVILFYLNWGVSFLALIFIPILYLIPYYYTKKLRKAFELWVNNHQRIFEQLQEILSHIQLIKSFAKENSHKRHYIKNLINNTRLEFKNIKLEGASIFTNTIASYAALGLIVLFGGYQVVKGNLTLGTLSAMAIYLTQLAGLQNSIGMFFQEISLGFVSCNRLDAVLEEEAHALEFDSSQQSFFSKGRIDFKNIIFGYDPQRLVLKNLNFSIDGSSCVGLVGASGSGKTTIMNLILRLYKLRGGEILIDGHNIYSIKAKSYYSQIGVVLQEPFLWNDTIENNIRYGEDDANFEEMQEAARISNIDSFIRGLPDGYNTIIGENACKISEGQKQRIALARAIIKRPKILILDEAFSCVDAMVEGKIIDNLKGYLAGSTIVVISHRFSTIRKVDLVYFLASPDSIDIDTHESILRRNVQYRNYLACQLQREDK